MQKSRNNILKDNSLKNELQDFIFNNNCSEAVSLLYKHQIEDWPLLKNGLDALSSVKTNKFLFNGYEIYTQFNPHRINSTSADVSTEAVKKRKCFLCTENLPKEQLGIIYKDKYSVLCNPFPIFTKHLTISSIEHTPQRITKSFADLLQLSKDFYEFCFIYNGPESGASAPDHLHFQAFNKDSLPINMDYEGLKNEYGEEIIRGEILVYAINDGLRKIFSLESRSVKYLTEYFDLIYSSYVDIDKSHIEPMMNIFSTYEEETGWRVIIFFRKKHRPDAYFKKGSGNIMVSPASIDLGGILITPLEKDFSKIDKNILSEIFREVAIGKEEFEYLKTKLKND